MQKEALHVLIGITKTGKKEVIDYTLFPTESISAYESLLTSMKERGVKKSVLSQDILVVFPFLGALK